MSTLSELSNIRNLDLAWNRILSGANYKYKKYFRDLYNTYDVSIQKNIQHLSERLEGQSYQPKEPIIIYEPKPSGYIRPISLLTIEDQIVLQAISNLYAKKFSSVRRKYENVTVFSNITDRKKDSLFFYEKWINSYNNFQIQSQNLFLAGSTWMMEFDLASFYDCISHDILIKRLNPKKHNSLHELIADCLKTWTNPNQSLQRGHGVPQGPIASDYLAEIMLLNIDEILNKMNVTYIRYADDFRFFDFSKNSVLKSLHKTDIICKQHGLIPQNSKIFIRKIKSIDDLKTFAESGDPDDIQDDEIFSLESDEAEEIFFESVDKINGKLLLKNKIKFVLRRSKPSSKIKKFLLKNLNTNLEFTEEIFTFFENYIKDDQVTIKIREQIFNRFDFVRGHSWFYLAKSIEKFKKDDLKSLLKSAITEVKKKSDDTLTRLGAMLFLFRAEKYGHGNYANYIISESTWFNKATLAFELPDRLLSDNKIIKSFFGKNHFEPSLTLGPKLLELGLSNNDLGVNTASLLSQTSNLYRELKIFDSQIAENIDPISEILTRRYKLKPWKKWKFLLSDEYNHALGILKQGDRLYLKSKDKWLSDQDSFNNLVFLEIIKLLKIKNIIGGNTTTIAANGKLIAYGVLLNSASKDGFALNYAKIASKFKVIHERRNSVPSSHPYNLRNLSRTQPLKESERIELTKLLKELYAEIINTFDQYL